MRRHLLCERETRRQSTSRGKWNVSLVKFLDNWDFVLFLFLIYHYSMPIYLIFFSVYVYFSFLFHLFFFYFKKHQFVKWIEISILSVTFFSVIFFACAKCIWSWSYCNSLKHKLLLRFQKFYMFKKITSLFKLKTMT